MRRIVFSFIGAIALIAIAAAVFVLRPASGPDRDLALAADAGHGDYLIRLGGCVACHTDVVNEGAFLAGGAPIESPFGTFVAPNITSDPEHGIGTWSLEDFSRAMSEGTSPGGAPYYPAFPYDFYTRLSDQDIVDLFAALQNVAPVADSAPDHDVGFPFNIRTGLLGWKALFFTPERFEPDPGRSERWNRGAYIVAGPGHCGACHTPRGGLGGVDHSRPLEGGMAPDITPEELVALGYDHEWLVEVLMGGVTPAFDVPGGDMALVISESTMHWTETDLDAVAAYLLDED